jgi:hypothetical protein
VNPVRLLIAAPDARLLRAVAAVLDADCQVRTARTGLDCVRQLRAAPPDLLALVPPLLWGSESGVVSVVEDDPALRRVSVLVFADPAGADASVAQFVPRDAGSDPRVGRIVTRLCRCVREQYHRAPAGATTRAGLA